MRTALEGSGLQPRHLGSVPVVDVLVDVPWKLSPGLKGTKQDFHHLACAILFPLLCFENCNTLV